MRLPLAQFKFQASRFAAVALCLWLSGALCLLNCNLTSASAAGVVPTVETAASETNFDDLPPCHRKAAKHKSETKDNNQVSLDSVAKFAGMMNCCGFFNSTFETAKSFQLAKVKLQKTSERFELPIPVVERRAATFYSSYKPPPPERGDTRLLNCVFLI